MQFGIAMATSADSWTLAQRAEELGFTHAWFYDTQMLSADCFVAMGAAAIKTSRIRLGTGVLIPSNRIAPVAANAFASLNKLAPGRIDIGIGTGFTGRRAMGMGAIKLAAFEEYIRVMTALLREETVEAELEGARHKIRLLNPELGLINTRDPIAPAHLGLSGRRAGRSPPSSAPAGSTSSATSKRGSAGSRTCRRAGRPPGAPMSDLSATAFALGCVLAPGEPYDSPRAMAQAGPRAAVVLHRAADEAIAGLPNSTPPHPSVAEAVRGLCRARQDLQARRRQVPQQPPRPPDVRQAGGAAIRHRRPDPHDELHRDRSRC